MQRVLERIGEGGADAPAGEGGGGGSLTGFVFWVGLKVWGRGGFDAGEDFARVQVESETRGIRGRCERNEGWGSVE